jgi:hypothetical protein
MKGRPKGLPKTGGRVKGVANKVLLKDHKIDNIFSFFDSFKTGNRYYVYGHFNKLTNECFYIGKGTLNRAWTSGARNEVWDTYVKTNGKYDIRILISDLTEDEAFMIERVLIEQRRPITNIQNIQSQLKFVL